MRIQKLELCGFKSFPDRTTFHFGGGISCVVGPNGSGKSNVVDALRWCIGEQSARSLRGSEMTDVIFAGSADRSPVGFAEVALTLTSEGGEPFPGEYAQHAELQLCRRLHRSGTSEYLINQVRVRRRDVVELLLDTGIGNNLYSFIAQGQVDRMVHATPFERRGIIDEAAGITRYAARREESRQRLEATSAQLDRAADVADEMARRLRDLERQVIRAATFRRLRARIRQAEIFLSLVKYSELSADRRALRTSLREVEGELAATRREMARRETDLASRREELEVAEGAAHLWRDEVAEVDARIRELDSACQLHERRRLDAETQIERAKQEAEDAARQAETASAERDAAVAEQEALRQAIDAIDAATERAAAPLVEAEGEVARTRARVAACTNHLHAARSAEATAEARATAAERALISIPERRRRLEEAMAGNVGRNEELASRRHALRSEHEVARAQMAQLAERVRATEAEAFTSGEVERAARQAADAADVALTAARSEADRSRRNIEERRDASTRAREAALRERRVAAADRVREERGRVEVLRRAMWDRARAEREAAEARANEWVNAAITRKDREMSGWVSRQREVLAEQDASDRSAIQALERELRLRLDQAVLEAEQRRDDRVRAVASHRARADAAVAERMDALRVLEAGAARVDRDIAAAIDRRGELRARVERGRAADQSRMQLTACVPDPRPLMDVVGLTPEEAEALGVTLGARLLAPWIRDRRVLARLVEGLGPEGCLDVVYVEGPDPIGTLREHVRVVDDLAAAVDGPMDRTRVTRDGRVRVDIDGMVHVGAMAPEVEEAVTARRALLDVEQVLTKLEQASLAMSERLEVARTALRSAESELVERRAEFEQVSSEGREAVDTVRAETQRGNDDDLDRARIERSDARERAWAAMERSLHEQRAARDASAARERETMVRAIEVVSREADNAARAAIDDAERALQVLERETEVALDAWSAEQGAAAQEERRKAETDLAADESRVHDATEAAVARRNAFAVANERLRVVEGALATLRSQAAALQVDMVRVEGEQAAMDLAILELGERSAALARERVDLDAIEDELRAEVDLAERARGEARVGVQSANDALHDAVDAADGAMASERVLRDAAQARDIERALLNGRLAAAVASCDAAGRRLEESHARNERADESMLLLERTRADAAHERHVAESDRDAQTVIRAERWDRLQTERERLRALRDGLRAAEDDLGRLRSQREGLERQQAEVEQRNQDIKVEIEVLRRRMDDRYQLSLPALLDRLAAAGQLVLDVDRGVRTGLQVGGQEVPGLAPVVVRTDALGDPDRVEREVQELERLRAETQSLGEVNLAAIDEHREVEARHADLQAQRADLEESIASIRAAIAKMNRTCRERFREAFDRVNEHFQLLYPRLVGGGHARLALTDEEDLLETGVDIFVQPPGKRLQNLTLLSGGEKAMTAIALMISLFQVKPSPFCVLDEVDAPLDEGNGSRFNEILREMSSVSQFLVITHNRKTMECADTLYGVTMAQPGVSRLVSVAL